MLQGVGALFLRKSKELQGLGYGWFAQEQPITINDNISEKAEDTLKLVQEDLSGLLEKFNVNTSISAPSVYRDATDYIIWLYKACLVGADTGHLHRFIGTMPIRLPPAYLELLESHDPLAMALLARCLVLLSIVKYKWWLHGAGDYEVLDRDIRGISELMPTDFKWAMDWPRVVVAGHITLDV